MLKQTDTAAAAIELVNELLAQGPVSAQAAKQAIDLLHIRTRAASVAVWSITDTRATRIVGVGDDGQPDPASALDLDEPSTLLERLRRHGAVTCHSDEVSGLEDLVSEGVRSFVVAATPKIGNVIGALVIGWGSLHPPCDESTLAHLRVAAALLHRALTSRPVEALDLADAILGSLADRIAVLDQNGQIVATNAAWSVSAPDRLQDSVASPVPAANYFDLLRREADEGSFDAAPILEGIQAVARGDVGFHQTAYPSYANGQLQWCVLTATRFQHPDGGRRGRAAAGDGPEYVGEPHERTAVPAPRRRPASADLCPVARRPAAAWQRAVGRTRERRGAVAPRKPTNGPMRSTLTTANARSRRSARPSRIARPSRSSSGSE